MGCLLGLEDVEDHGAIARIGRFGGTRYGMRTIYAWKYSIVLVNHAQLCGVLDSTSGRRHVMGVLRFSGRCGDGIDGSRNSAVRLPVVGGPAGRGQPANLCDTTARP